MLFLTVLVLTHMTIVYRVTIVGMFCLTVCWAVVEGSCVTKLPPICPSPPPVSPKAVFQSC